MWNLVAPRGAVREVLKFPFCKEQFNRAFLHKKGHQNETYNKISRFG